MSKIGIWFLVLFIMYSSNIFAEGSLYSIKHKDKVKQDYEIHIDYPVFNGLPNEKLQEEVNNKVSNKLENTVREVKRVAEQSTGFPVLYYEEEEVIEDDKMISIVMTSNISRGNNYNSTVSSINFENGDNGRILTLEDVVEMPSLNQEVKKQMANEPDTYFHQSFNSVREDTAFYINGEQIILVFNKYEIAPGVYGTPEISIPLDRVRKDQSSKETNVPLPQII
ncbi:DUF3298 and DUF4163 domain-containing protein [Halobacillus shinanisalinarum]|uniref:DUF3298 and DUF4163 domain-containing protein n=1 Tax=Halobacillus shinanisalinarum TaxID=2932258 RepID=A0ABY4GWQ5_9BACI|nr:DUF3298 and DUF4163 domain-containing protein [Halobacillus shinanisalinarum]UOQ92607.1 DUF3298 and DUF4163 domain-containing protein [Halobacillus shinanisalinarum]